MSQVMDQGKEQSLVEEQMGALIDQSINIERNVADSHKSIQEQGNKIAGLEERVGRIESTNTQIALTAKSIDDNVKKLAAQRHLTAQGAADLETAMAKFAASFDNPSKKSIHHTHFIGKPLQFLGGAFILIFGLALGWWNAWNTSRTYMGNDIKWRYMMQSSGTVLKGTLAADSLYQTKPDQFRTDVEFEENRRARYYAKLLQQSQTDEEVDELKRQEKKR